MIAPSLPEGAPAAHGRTTTIILGWVRMRRHPGGTGYQVGRYSGGTEPGGRPHQVDGAHQNTCDRGAGTPAGGIGWTRMVWQPASGTRGTEQARRTCKTSCPEQFIRVRAARGAPECSRNGGRDHGKPGRHLGVARGGARHDTASWHHRGGTVPRTGRTVPPEHIHPVRARWPVRGARYTPVRAGGTRHPRRTTPRTARPDTRGPPPGARCIPGIYAPNPPRPAHPDMSHLAEDQRAARRSEPSHITPQPSVRDRQEPAPPGSPPNQAHGGSSQGPRRAAHPDKS